MRQLFIDLGHSQKFPGASGVKAETVWNRQIWTYLRSKIDIDRWQIVVVPDAYATDVIPSANLNLVKRIAWINSHCKDGDWVFSIHGDSGPADVRGVTTCFMGGSSYAQALARECSQTYSKITGVPLFGDGAFDDRTSRFKRLGMVRDTRPLALLIEAGFVTNTHDMAVPPDLAATAIAAFLNAH